MIELKITGQDSESFLANVKGVIAFFSPPPGARYVDEAPALTIESAPAVEPRGHPESYVKDTEARKANGDYDHAPPVGEVFTPAETEQLAAAAVEVFKQEPPKRRGRPPKPKQEAPADEVTEAAPEHTGASSGEPLTLDTIRDRMREILNARGEVLLKRGVTENLMPQKMEYLAGLLVGKFNVPMATKLPKEKYADFMAASEPYLTGEDQ